MSACIVSGIQTSGFRNARKGPKNPGAAMPITVRLAPPTMSSRPMIAGSPLEAALPVRVADDHDRIAADGGGVARLDQPAGLRALTEALEEAAGDELHLAPLRRVGAAREPHLHLGRRRRGKQLRAALDLRSACSISGQE